MLITGSFWKGPSRVGGLIQVDTAGRQNLTVVRQRVRGIRVAKVLAGRGLPGQAGHHVPALPLI